MSGRLRILGLFAALALIGPSCAQVVVEIGTSAQAQDPPGAAAQATVTTPQEPSPEGDDSDARAQPLERLIIPALGLDVPVAPMQWRQAGDGGLVRTLWSVPDDAAGYMIDSSVPGRGGNVVLAGHNNLGSRVFRDLSELQPGDRILVHAGPAVHEYQVRDRFLLRERGAPQEQRRQNASWIAPTADARLTLVSCWPRSGNDFRVVVVARPVRDGGG